MRVVVIGTSGAGKSALSQKIATHFDIEMIELDALNWRPDWEALSVTNPAQFLADVDAATQGDAWVAAGNYTKARHILWARATHLVWLDYPRHVVMSRVIRRSIVRGFQRAELWNGNRESFRLWLGADHPIWWAWRTWQKNRTATVARLAEANAAHLTVLQVKQPRDVGKVILALERSAWREEPSK